MKNSFGVKTKIMLGDGLREAMASFKRVFVVTDGFMVKSGKIQYVVERLAVDAEYEIFSDVFPDPDIETIAQAVAAYQTFSPDVVVAFGGGSPIDAAKAVVFFAAQIEKRQSWLVAVPTTSGTGSEVTKFAVISDSVKQVKFALVDDQLVPDVAILDASLVLSTPQTVTADTAMDALTHSIEAYVSSETNDFSQALAERAVKILIKNTITVYESPDNLEARQNIHIASCLAGAAFSNAGLGLTHGLAHAVGARFKIPHGRANAILLPYVMSFNAGCSDSLTPTATVYAELSHAVGLESSSKRQSALNLIRTVRNMGKQIGIPISLSEAGVSKNDFAMELQNLAEAAYLDKSTQTNPRSCTYKDIEEVLQKAYTGKMP